ncbi:hypothetical protein [Sphingomonas sp. CROZ-RG-20F-R02-07]|uniref:hypothetical protein n=1 Tax=Sphingomonas sp. CROZ-RG-20F-R02-07 TaxID=2914832 RepID=UPI001F58FBE6|nr:hypothetical protein [Sphingomonas sp. CROZ-RG-20F-R02-07]
MFLWQVEGAHEVEDAMLVVVLAMLAIVIAAGVVFVRRQRRETRQAASRIRRSARVHADWDAMLERRDAADRDAR